MEENTRVVDKTSQSRLRRHVITSCRSLLRLIFWRSRASEKSTIQYQGLPRHKPGRAGTHPNHRLSHFARLAESADGVMIKHPFLDFGFSKQTIGHRGFDYRGTNCVDSNSTLCNFERRRLRQSHYAMFAGGVGRSAVAPNETSDRRVIN